jgi:type IV pilus assembly protein PilX
MISPLDVLARIDRRARAAQHGAVLVVALVFLLLMTLLGVTAMRGTTLQERMAGNLRDNNLALQAAEAALREGEQFLQQAALPPFAGADGLLQPQSESGQAEYWEGYDWDGNSRVAATFDGVAQGPAAAPRYVIEELPPVVATGDSQKFGALPDVGFYRVTAYAVGGTTDAVSIIQSTYRR